ncbi:MAG: aldo/keto reductase [Synergistaceae bacterium]|nr:aldo/keto reductase [Synergistaceae bacterium]
MLHFTLNNGLQIPAIGFGTYKASQEAMTLAVQAGYKYFDTASFYGNESVLGRVLSQSKIPRNEFFIASKVWKTDLGCEAAINSLNRTLENLGTDYVDIYLIHWPRPDLDREDWRELDIETWRAMETLHKQGKIRALGLSNFLPYHAENIINHCEIMPSVAQLEFHAGHTQTFALNYYRSQNILLQAWSPIGRGRVLNDVLITELAEKYQISPVQVCLAFCLHENVMPLPKASSPERLRENLDAVNISLEREDIMRLENMPPLGWSGEHPDRVRVQI